MPYQEVMGSRKTRTTGKQTSGVQIGVTDDNSGIPATGDYFTGDSGLTGKIVTQVDVNPEVIPGLAFVEAQSQGFVAYA